MAVDHFASLETVAGIAPQMALAAAALPQPPNPRFTLIFVI